MPRSWLHPLLTSIQEQVDGTIGAIRRAELDAHLRTCEECRALLADLERIRDAAGDSSAAAAARSRVAADRRTAPAGRPHQAADSGPHADGVAAGRRILAIAAALILGGRIIAVAPSPELAPAPSPAAQPARRRGDRTPAVEAVQTEVEQAQKQMETAISHMEQIAKTNQQALDPRTAATLDKNLDIIDQAIAETRAAVKAEPASVAARGALFGALKQKVTVLQDTIALHQRDAQGQHRRRRTDRRRTEQVMTVDRRIRYGQARAPSHVRHHAAGPRNSPTRRSIRNESGRCRVIARRPISVETAGGADRAVHEDASSRREPASSTSANIAGDIVVTKDRRLT